MRDPDGVVRLQLEGELDLSVAAQLKRLARDEPAARVEVSNIDLLGYPRCAR